MKKKGWFYFLLGWLIPGAGHFLLGRKRDGIILFLSMVYFIFMGIYLGGRFIGPNEGSPLTVFITFADLGNGLLYFVTKLLGYGTQVKATLTSDYGSFYLAGAGLINYMAAVKAFELAEGPIKEERKPEEKK